MREAERELTAVLHYLGGKKALIVKEIIVVELQGPSVVCALNIKHNPAEGLALYQGIALDH